MLLRPTLARGHLLGSAALFLVASGLALATAAAPAAPSKPNKQMQKVLDALADLHPKPIETLDADEARKQPTPADAVMKVLADEGQSTAPVAVGKVEDKSIPGPGGDIPIRVYTPGHAPFPVLVYFHGGGFVIATIDTYDASTRALANGAGCVVVSVEYRKAPVHKFPAAHEDAYAAYEWVTKNATSLGGDPSRIAVGGEGAGGNLASAVAMMARDRKAPAPVHQLLIYPIAAYPFLNESYKENEFAKPLDAAMMQWFFKRYDPLAQPGHPELQYLNLLGQANLKSLPSATVITAEIDPLRTEGQQYAKWLEKAGSKVASKTYDGVTHEFFGMGAVVDEARKAEDLAAGELKKAFK